MGIQQNTISFQLMISQRIHSYSFIALIGLLIIIINFVKNRVELMAKVFIFSVNIFLRLNLHGND